MKNFLSSKIFVIISTLSTLIIGGLAGWLLGYQPSVNGKSFYGGYGDTTTEYVFQIKAACGYWLIAILITFVVLLLCLTIRKLYAKHSIETEIDG